MIKDKTENNKLIFKYTILGLIIIIVILFLFKTIFLDKVKFSKDIGTNIIFDSLPSDEIIKDYDSYKSFIKKNLSSSKYQEEIMSNDITYDLFDKYDYIAMFYETNSCDIANTLKRVTKYKNKIILSVKKLEDDECNLNTRILFVPVDKGKYIEVPKIIIKKI